MNPAATDRNAKHAKGFSLLLAVGFALAAAACSGGGSTQPPPPPTGNFSNASLKGQYAFFMSGTNAASGAFFARAGSFTADGNGNISTGLEDVDVNGLETFSFSPSTYTIQANGDRKSTRLNSSHVEISYAVFCLK